MSDTDTTAPPIIVATPTVMDGLVLRWYRDSEAWNWGDQVCSASRNGVQFDEGCPTDWVAEADTAFRLLNAGRTDEARVMATHKPTRLIGGELEYIGPATVTLDKHHRPVHPERATHPRPLPVLARWWCLVTDTTATVPDEAVRAILGRLYDTGGRAQPHDEDDLRALLAAAAEAGWVLVPGPVETETAWIWPDGDVRDLLPSEIYPDESAYDERCTPAERQVTAWRPAPESTPDGADQ